MEDRRRRRVAFEQTTWGILRYPEDSEDLKVSIKELQEQLGKSEEAGISIKHVAQQARNENGQKIFEFFRCRRTLLQMHHPTRQQQSLHNQHAMQELAL